MQKTSVYLSEEQAERLARLAREEDRPQAEIIRDAIDGYRTERKPDRNFALYGSGRGDGTPLTQEVVDELMKGFGQ